MGLGEPVWEWAEGDRGKANAFRWATVIVLALGCATAVVLTLPLLNQVGAWTGPVIPAYVESFLALLALVGAMFLGLFPTQYPILRRVGISSVGLRLVFPLRAITVKWPTIQWIGPDYMDAQLGRTRLHVRLTPGQVQQISNFLGRPLA